MAFMNMIMTGQAGGGMGGIGGMMNVGKSKAKKITKEIFREKKLEPFIFLLLEKRLGKNTENFTTHVKLPKLSRFL